MSIKKYFISKPKENYQYDRKENKWFSWGFDVWIAGERIRERGLPTRRDAEISIEQLKQNARNERLGITLPSESPLLLSLFQKKLDTLPPGPERSRAKRVMQAFLALLPKAIKVTELRSVHFQSYINSRAVSASTIKRELVPVIAALNAAGSYFEELESYNPPKITKPKIPKTQKTKIISPAEAKLIINWLLDEANDNGRGLMRRTGLFLQLCLLTASRPGEIAKLKKSDIDFSEMLLTVEATKTRFESVAGLRYLSISKTMEAILRERIDQTATEYLFTRSGKVTGKMYAALKAACEANGIIYGKNEPFGITFVRSRHTGITNMLRSGIDIQTVGTVAGHSNSTMSLHYAHGNQNAVKQALLELEKHFQN